MARVVREFNLTLNWANYRFRVAFMSVDGTWIANSLSVIHRIRYCGRDSRSSHPLQVIFVSAWTESDVRYFFIHTDKADLCNLESPCSLVTLFFISWLLLVCHSLHQGNNSSLLWTRLACFALLVAADVNRNIKVSIQLWADIYFLLFSKYALTNILRLAQCTSSVAVRSHFHHDALPPDHYPRSDAWWWTYVD